MKAIKGTISYNAKISRMVRQMPWRTIEETQLTSVGCVSDFTVIQIHTEKEMLLFF